MALNATEANCLKELLDSWELADLFQLLRDEEISVKVLKIMKRHHLKELLKNQTLGIRIRFEHHFEQWRQLIRIPLDGTINQQPTAVDAQQTSANTPKTVKRSSTANNNVGPSTLTLRPFITVSKNQTLDEESLITKPNTSVAEETLTTAATDFSQYQHVNVEKQSKDSGITVLKILKESGAKGESLLQAYEEQQTFTPLQRQLLITLIVAFFEMKNYHLSLSTSQILEKQIVDLFPTEQIESYRGKKKSKIYMKYSNVKRRDTDFFPSKKRARTANTNEAENSNSDVEMIADSLGQRNTLKGKTVATIESTDNDKIDEQLNAYLIKSEYFSD